MKGIKDLAGHDKSQCVRQVKLLKQPNEALWEGTNLSVRVTRKKDSNDPREKKMANQEHLRMLTLLPVLDHA